MNSFMPQPEITSWNQVHDVGSLIEFYTNCYNYLPQLFIIAGLFAAVVGYYVAVNREKIMYDVRILIIAGKMYLNNKKNLYKGGD